MADWERYLRGKRVWVTGASSGIGEALVDILGKAGIATLASARRADRLGVLAARHASVSVLPFDLADRERLGEIATRAWDQLGGIDVLVNNAGISMRSAFVEADPEVLERVLAVDLLGTMRLTHAVASRMVSQESGHIVTVTSLAALIPPPRRTAYAAAKAGLHALFDAMRGELEPRGITISLAVPGYVKTEISTHAVSANGTAHGRMDANQEEGRTPEECAIHILNKIAARRREFLVAMTPKLWLALLLRRVAPGILLRMLPKAART
ncbi:MAG: SDR family NAD(P)-dependent oxidoreductase [Spirochaetota bacterium]